MTRLLIVGLFLIVPVFCSASEFSGEVVNVIDGDTVVVLAGNKQVRVRLAYIDAPEKGQPFGNRSRQSLIGLCHRKQSSVENLGADRYGRVIGVVKCGQVDAGRSQVASGMAWVFVRYAPAESPLYALQDAARSKGAGLWADSDPMPPWEWRRR